MQAVGFEARAAQAQGAAKLLQEDKSAVLRTLVATEIELQRLASKQVPPADALIQVQPLAAEQRQTKDCLPEHTC